MTGEYQPHIEGLSEREILEGMSPDSIVNTILTQGEKVSDIERSMNLASDVLQGAYGLTVEEVLRKREKDTNGEAKIVSP